MRIPAKNQLSFIANILWWSAAIGVGTSAMLTLARGGFDDMPSVLLVFWALGFLIALFLFWFFRFPMFQRMDSLLQRIARTSSTRDVLAVVFALSLLIWSGPVIRSGGYAGWLVSIPFVIFSALAVCLLASRFPIVFGAFVALCIVISVQVDYVRFEWAHPTRSFPQLWKIFWQVFQPVEFAVRLLIAFGLSLAISLPICVQRRRQKVAA